ncbi:unnamed protein product, partial [Allacma fusca]
TSHVIPYYSPCLFVFKSAFSTKEMECYFSMSDAEEQKPKGFQPKKWPQLLAGLIAANGAFALGTVLAWPSPCIPELVKSKELGDLSGSQPSC